MICLGWCFANDSTKFIFGSSRHQISEGGPNARIFVTGVWQHLLQQVLCTAIVKLITKELMLNGLAW